MEYHGSSTLRETAACVLCRAVDRRGKLIYQIVRMYFNGGKTVIDTGLTLKEAQAHCHDPETSSSTCTTDAGLRRTFARGKWFDGYEEMK